MAQKMTQREVPGVFFKKKVSFFAGVDTSLQNTFTGLTRERKLPKLWVVSLPTYPQRPKSVRTALGNLIIDTEYVDR